MSVHDVNFSLLQKISIIAENDGQRLAVIAGEKSVTYQAMEREAKRLAYAIQRYNFDKDSVIAIYLPRSADIVIAMLGIMKSGMAYAVVEDDGNTTENYHRLNLVQPHLIITSSHHVEALQKLNKNVIDIDQSFDLHVANILPEINLEDSAYVLFTSGSTGVPKGVMISHGNIYHYVSGLLEKLAIQNALQYAHVSTFSADLGNTGLFLSLWTGGTLHIIDDNTKKDPFAFLQYLIQHNIDFLKITPSHWAAIFNALSKHYENQQLLKYLVLGGESLSVPLARLILQSNATEILVNHYGPTETTVGVAAQIITDEQMLATYENIVPIGKPFGQTEIFIKTADGQRKQLLAEGELYIGGPSVGKGYINDVESTNARFIFDENTGLRFYKTGDLVRVDDEGILEFLGRIDRQVKINGYRVELEHIEYVLKNIAGIEQVVVCCLDLSGKNMLAAALVVAKNIEIERLQDILRQKLPAYMIPDQFVCFDDFPRNSNGKTDIKALAELLKEELKKPRLHVKRDLSDPLLEEIVQIWQKYLQHDNFGLEDDFFKLGANSIDAILIISDLQARGYQITANTFLANRTITALAAKIKEAANKKELIARNIPQHDSQEFSGAQNWFFEKQFSEENHWNQAVLLQSSTNIVMNVFTKAIAKLLEAHPLLHTAYQQCNRQYQAKLVAVNIAACLSFSEYEEMEEKDIAVQIMAISKKLHKEIDIVKGNVFKVHIFKFKKRPAQILLIAHHLSVDAISWRIIVSDLVHFYGAAKADVKLEVFQNPYSYWDWVNHLIKHKMELQKDLSCWNKMSQSVVDKQETDNVEKAAKTIWLAFSREESDCLLHGLSKKINISPHILLLAVFAYVIAKDKNQSNLLIDIESYGRLSLEEKIDISHVVGWFTSMFPVNFAIDQSSLMTTIESINNTLTNVPNLGVAYGQFGHEISCQPNICYNYLGDFDFCYEGDLNIALSRYPIAQARGDTNHRIHDLKLTARIIGQQLIVDLSFPAKKYSAGSMQQLMEALHSSLLAFAGLPQAETQLLLEDGSSTGLLSYTPASFELSSNIHLKRDYKNIFLTGVTGYMGIHAFHQLLQETSAHIYCLIRAETIDIAKQRLQEIYQWYFAEQTLEDHAHRYTVLCGDISEQNFSLSTDSYEYLCSNVDAIYHFAASTRLFGERDYFKKQNIDSIESIIDLASRNQNKDIHYASTLAICGVNPHEKAVVFSERSLYVGQIFQNEYERSKFQAEKILHDFIVQGGRAFIYRCGNVSGHSLTGRFQKNAQDNRFIQFLNAIITLGKLPENCGEDVVLSPVDEVTQAIVSLSLAESIPGVFHVDNHVAIPMREIFSTLQELGVSFQKTQAKDFVSLFDNYVDQKDPVLMLGHFWAKRQDRNISYQHQYTHTLLNKLGYHFSSLDADWRRKFFAHLLEQKIFNIN